MFLHNQKLLRFTRLYLIGSLLLCLLFPLLPKAVGLLPFNIIEASTLSLPQAEQYLPELVLTPQLENSALSFTGWLLLIYLSGAGVSMLWHLVRLVQLRRLLQQLHFRPTAEGYLLAHLKGNTPTFSFFRYLAINKGQLSSEEEYRLIVQHEKAHAQQQHTADVLLATLTQVVLWFHPAIYVLSRMLRQTHEHLADASVLKHAESEASYIALMSRQCLAAAGLPFVSTFFQSITINRIRMIKKNTLPSTRWRMIGSMLLGSSLVAFVACDKQSVYELMPPPPPPVEIHNNTVGNSPNTSAIFEIVEEEALPVGGMQAFYRHLSENIRYPEEAQKNKVEGKAFIRFIIDETGTVISAEPVAGRALGYGLDEEAIRVIKTSKWVPAKHGGTRVKQRKILPINFLLENASNQESTKNQTSMLFRSLLKAPEKESC